MPYKSKAQAAWMHINRPDLAKEWDKHTQKDEKLPQHVKKKKAAISVEQAFKAGFIMRCIDEQLTNEQIHSRIKSGLALEKKGFGEITAWEGLKHLGSGLMDLGAVGLVGLPIATGAVGGYVAAKATSSPEDEIENVKRQELINTYNFLADEAERKAKLKRQQLGLPDKGKIWTLPEEKGTIELD